MEYDGGMHDDLGMPSQQLYADGVRMVIYACIACGSRTPILTSKRHDMHVRSGPHVSSGANTWSKRGPPRVG